MEDDELQAQADQMFYELLHKPKVKSDPELEHQQRQRELKATFEYYRKQDRKAGNHWYFNCFYGTNRELMRPKFANMKASPHKYHQNIYIRQCAVCKKLFYQKGGGPGLYGRVFDDKYGNVGYAESKAAKFCSQKCRYLVQLQNLRSRRQREKENRKPHDPVKCQFCNQQFTPKRRQNTTFNRYNLQKYCCVNHRVRDFLARNNSH